ncbi:MAG: hypothetical protein NVS3B7_16930 [Candidatus Elarobacter sp.]
MDGEPLTAVLEAFASGALSGTEVRFAPDATYHEARREPIRGREAIARHFSRFAASGAAWRFEVDALLRDGLRACVQYRFHLAEGASVSGRERAGCAIVRLDDCGLIVEWREYEG